MKRSLYPVLLAGLVLAGCAKEAPVAIDSASKVITVTANAEAPVATKATATDAGVIAWSTGDQIGVFDDNDDTVYPLTFVDGTDKSFSGTVSSSPDLKGAVAPFGDAGESVDVDGAVLWTVTLPATYSNYVPGTTNAPMVASAPAADGDNYIFEFKHIAALAKVTYVNVPVGAKTLYFEADANISGSQDITISEENVEFTTPSTSASTSVKLDMATAVTVANQTMAFYIPVPVGTYTEFKVKLLDSDNNTVSGTAKKLTVPDAEQSFTRAELYILPSIKLDAVTPVFYESFDKCSSTGGNDGSWSGSVASVTPDTDNEGWTFVSGNAASKCVKLGTGSKQGSATTPALGITSDIATLTFRAGAWSNDATTLNLSVEGNGNLNESSVTLSDAAFSDYTLYIGGADSDTKVVFSANTTSKNRFFLDEVYVYAGGEAFDYLTVSPTDISVAFATTTASFAISTGSAWAITTSSAVDGFSLDASSGTGNATVTATFPAVSAATDVATLTVTVGELTKTVTIKQVEPTVSLSATTLSFEATGGSQTVTATTADFNGDVTISASSDNTQFTTSVDGSTITVTAAENSSSEIISGTITVSATDGTDTKSATVAVTQAFPVTPASDGDVLWSEDFSSYSTGDVPSGTVTTSTGRVVYGGSNATYASVTPSSNGSTTKIYSETSAGGTSPELLISKNSGSFTVAGIPTGGATGMTLSFKSNNGCTPSSTIDGVTIGSNLGTTTAPVYAITLTSGVSTISLTFTNSNTSKNTRVDDFKLVAGVPVAGITVTTADATSTASTEGTSAVLNGVIGLVNGAAIGSVTEEGFYYKLSSATEYTKVTLDSDAIAASFSYTLSSLTADSEYSFYAYAVYNSGSEVTGEALTFTPTVKTSTTTYVDVLNQTLTEISGTSYTATTKSKSDDSTLITSDAEYSFQCAGDKSSIQLRSSNKNSGIVTTKSGGTVKQIVVTWNTGTTSGRQICVYGSNSAYSTPSDLYTSDKQGTLISTLSYPGDDTSVTLTVSDSYAFIGICSKSGAQYISEIDVTWEN